MEEQFFRRELLQTNNGNGTVVTARVAQHGMVPSVVIAAAVGIVIFFLYVIFRKIFPKFFMSKAYHREYYVNPPDASKSSGWFNWIPYVLRFDEEALFEEHGGLDMLQYLTFLKYAFFLFAAISILGVASLATNLTGENDFNDDLQTTMSNIEDRSKRFWVHVISVAIFSLLACTFVYKFASKTSEQRARHIAKGLPTSRSVLIENVPTDYNNNASFKEYFSSFYGRKQVNGAIVVPECKKAEKLRIKREALVQKYKLAYHHKTATGEDKMVSEKLCGAKFPATQLYERKIREIDQELINEQNQQPSNTRVGVVTFDSIASALMCAQTRHNRKYSTMRPLYAPERSEIIWGNLNKSRIERVIRYWISTIIMVALFLFWTIPVIFLSGFSNLETLEQVNGFGWLSFVLDLSPFVRGIIAGLLPTLVLTIFMALLPTIIRAIFSIRCYTTKSRLDRAVGSAYWWFLFLNVFLIVTLAGSATRGLQRFIDDPSGIPKNLAQTLPGQGPFYFNYVAVNSFITTMVFILGGPGVAIYILKSKIAKSDYERNQAAMPAPHPIFKTYAANLIIFTVGLVFSVMSPLINFLTTAYFALQFFAVKNNFVFSHKPEYDGVLMNTVAFPATIIAIIIFQLTMIGLFAINVFPPGFIVLATLILTIFFIFWVNKEFSTIQEISPLDKYPRSTKVQPIYDNFYRPPALSSPPRFEDLLLDNVSEAEDIENQRRESVRGSAPNNEKLPESPLLSDRDPSRKSAL